MKQILVLLATLALFCLAVLLQAQSPTDETTPLGALEGLVFEMDGKGIHGVSQIDCPRV